jgi:arsenate reductase
MGNCGTSRSTFALIRNAGIEPTVIEYLKTPPARATLLNLLERMKLSPRQLLRKKGTPHGELKPGEPRWSDGELVDQMLKFPILINRPIVTTERGVKLCRPFRGSSRSAAVAAEKTLHEGRWRAGHR